MSAADPRELRTKTHKLEFIILKDYKTKSEFLRAIDFSI